MTIRPSIRRAPPPRGHVAGRWPATALGLVAVAAALVLGCQAAEGPAGLLVTSGGTLQRLDEKATLVPVAGLPSNVRQVAAAGGTIVVVTADEQYLVASSAAPTVEDVTWRPLPVAPPGDRLMTGIDVSPDGRSLAIAWGGDIAVEESALIIVDIATGESRERRVGSASNGPPSWLSNDVVALETLTLAAESGVASINVTAGNGPIPSRSRGFGLSATVDGTRIAVADDTTGSIVVTDPGAWWNGDPVSPGVRPPDGLGVVDLAIDADGTRLAAAFGSGDSPDYAIQIYHLDGGTWHLVRTLSLTSETPPTIDWLE